MEKVLSADEKVRRAEEIYLRRMQNGTSRVAKVSVETNKKDVYIKKLCVQFVMCLLIYIAFYTIKNSEEILPQNITNKINEILQYDINIEALQGKINKYIIEVNGDEVQEIEENLNENSSNETLEENILPQDTLGVTDNVEDNLENKEIEQNSSEEEASSISQMQEDANYIKANYSLIKPLEGQITSRFGLRENVYPKYHTGIDIAEDEGTVICAAMEGTVSVASGTGNYGNHIEITNGDISTLYAHCKTLYVKVGDYVTQGQKIAEVGQTGNATGPHLHFEILRKGELVNPDLVLEF